MKSLLLAVLLSFTGVAFAAPVNINDASAETIANSLKGIGPAKAAAIVQYRNENGPFKSVEELKFVKGIGGKIWDEIKQDILLSSNKD